ncbi:hypothetical protein SAMN04488564_103623 [Lentzea waywayandensis]|uniref:Uncharacterized protein n=1 Tax=Lentzea waywayandensis TaxID=84724 RepID=A0A1I6E1N9_9PSEU|nr:hypothetical protein [Lentzea waywayandensis]SFR11660.1 hypothetical protein SAMN04488564_103623 [Lentzea waywayandensis]
MDHDNRHRNKIITVLLATTGIGMVTATALIAVMVLLRGTNGAVSPAEAPTTRSSAQAAATGPAITTPQGACTTPFSVSTPAERTTISASGGAVFSGTACDGDLIWILDFDPTDGYYYQTNERPLLISPAGKWEFRNAPIGNTGDSTGTVYPVVVLRTSAACSDALRAMAPDSSRTVRFTPLPAACPSTTDKENYRVVELVNGGP